MDHITALPGNFGEFLVFAVIAAATGYGAYRLLWEDALFNSFTPLRTGAGVVSAGASITAGVFALVAFWAVLLGLFAAAVLGVIAWAVVKDL